MLIGREKGKGRFFISTIQTEGRLLSFLSEEKKIRSLFIPLGVSLLEGGEEEKIRLCSLFAD